MKRRPESLLKSCGRIVEKFCGGRTMFVLRPPFVRARSSMLLHPNPECHGFCELRKSHTRDAEGEGVEMVLDFLGKHAAHAEEKPRPRLGPKVRPLAVRNADMLALRTAREARLAAAAASSPISGPARGANAIPVERRPAERAGMLSTTAPRSAARS